MTLRWRVYGLFLAGALLFGACSAAPAGAPAQAPAATAPAVKQDGGGKAMADKVMSAKAMADEAVSEEAMSEQASEQAMHDEGVTAALGTETPGPEDVTKPTPDAGMSDAPTAVEPETGMEDDGMAAAPEGEAAAADAMPVLPAWQLEALTDARTGAAIRLADFKGRTVFVEPFATWCTSCKRQFGNLQAAQPKLGADVVLVALSVEPNIGNAALEDYANANGFDFVFAAMPPAMLQALAAQFGQTIANPPATPHFLIRPDGSTTELFTGVKPPDEIIAQVAAER